MWTNPDGTRLLRRIAPRCRAPNITFHTNKIGSIIRSSGTVFYSLLYLNSQLGFDVLKYLSSVISVKIDPESLPANAKNRKSTRLWTARVWFLHPWAARQWLRIKCVYQVYVVCVSCVCVMCECVSCVYHPNVVFHVCTMCACVSSDCVSCAYYCMLCVCHMSVSYECVSCVCIMWVLCVHHVCASCVCCVCTMCVCHCTRWASTAPPPCNQNRTKTSHHIIVLIKGRILVLKRGVLATPPSPCDPNRIATESHPIIVPMTISVKGKALY